MTENSSCSSVIGSSEILDPYDPAALRLNPSLSEGVPTKKVIVSIKVEKPNKQDFIRVHPTHRLETAVIEVRRDKEFYIVHPSLQVATSDECYSVVLLFYVNTAGTPGWWPIRKPGADGKWNPYHESAMELSQGAINQWTRIQANTDAGRYEATVALAKMPEPVWPEMPLARLIELGFKGRIIDDINHPVLQKLRGEAV
jgi:hypothetical protein